jgi:hypothetical protein
MDAELKAKWVKALRSGGFEQCREELHDGFGYCCIGVGYQTLGEDSEEILEEDDPTSIAAKALGLSEDIEKKLVIMNDDEQLSFKEIADYIEQNL